jgi:hypothetical protein
LQGCYEIGEEANWVIITFVEGEPGEGLFYVVQPLHDERGLANAGRGGDKGQRTGKAQAFLKAACPKKPHVQPFDQAWARHQLRPNGRDIEFGGQEGRSYIILPGDALRLT